MILYIIIVAKQIRNIPKIFRYTSESHAISNWPDYDVDCKKDLKINLLLLNILTNFQ